MPDNDGRQSWVQNELKTGDPAYDGKYHPEHHHFKGSSLRPVLIIGGILSMLGGGLGILFGLIFLLLGIFACRK
jgi:hypothetical protein